MRGIRQCRWEGYIYLSCLNVLDYLPAMRTGRSFFKDIFSQGSRPSSIKDSRGKGSRSDSLEGIKPSMILCYIDRSIQTVGGPSQPECDRGPLSLRVRAGKHAWMPGCLEEIVGKVVT